MAKRLNPYDWPRPDPTKRANTNTGTRQGYAVVPRTTGVYGSGEMKYFTTTKADYAISASTNWTATEADPAGDCLFYPATGTSINQRVALKATMYKLKIRGTISCAAQTNQTTAKNSCQVRVIVFQDMQTNSTQAQGEQLMDGTGGGSATASEAINAFQSTDNFGRFRVWKDKTWNLAQPSMSFDGTNIEIAGVSRSFKVNLNFAKKPIEVRFNTANGGNVTDIVDHSFHVIAMCDDASMVPLLDYNCRVSFKG